MSGLQKSKQGNHIQAMVENEGLLNKRSVHSEIDSSFDFITGFPCVVRRYSKTYYPWSLSVETIITLRNIVFCQENAYQLNKKIYSK